MQIGCDVCGAAAAEVVCCSEEKAFCNFCDLRIHNTTDHQRLRLFASTIPKCDICQECLGFFFCLEHRSVLCRKCDVNEHEGNSLRAMHQRMLLSGIEVELHQIQVTQPSNMSHFSALSHFPEFEQNANVMGNDWIPSAELGLMREEANLESSLPSDNGRVQDLADLTQSWLSENGEH
ncbi:B-box zinc finger family protein [Striga asiatica]|uniref:B-box zinc finger family protein n=1 Tax=Striga asiatica TaxID=4170 RepID=A0A5A7QQM9_STRAF|nr:B-box zinc finger family protein [Striga asiatica]